MSGIRYACLAALLAVCLAAGTAAQAKSVRSSGLKVTVAKGYNWAQFSFSASVPTRAVVSISAGNGSCAMRTLDGRKKTHRVTMSALAPGTKYFYCIKTVPAKGKVLSASGSFVTDPPGPSDMQVRGGKLVLKSGASYYPFIPVTTTGFNCFTASSVSQLQSIGVNIVLDAAGCIADPSTWSAALEPMFESKMWLMQTLYRYETQMSDMPQLLHRDSPLLASFLIKGVPFNGSLDLGSCVPPSVEAVLNTYFLKMKSLAASQPVIFSTDISTPWASGRENCYDAPSMEAQLFAPLIAGVQGFDLQTKYGTGNLVGMRIKPELIPAVKDFTRVLATFGPALRTGLTAAAVSSSPDALVLAKKYGGYTYLFVLDPYNRRATSTTINFPHSANETALAVAPGAGKALLTKAGLNVKLAPLQWRIYRIGPK